LEEGKLSSTGKLIMFYAYTTAHKFYQMPKVLMNS